MKVKDYCRLCGGDVHKDECDPTRKRLWEAEQRKRVSRNHLREAIDCLQEAKTNFKCVAIDDLPAELQEDVRALMGEVHTSVRDHLWMGSPLVAFRSGNNERD